MNLKKDRNEWENFYTKVLKRTKTELNRCIDTNEVPLFGYPPVPYSPPPDMPEDAHASLRYLLDSIFTKNHKRSLSTIMEHIYKEQEKQ